MNPISGDAIVSCHVSVVSLLVMIVLLAVSKRQWSRKSLSIRVLFLLSLCVMANCILPFIYNAMYLQPAPWCHTAALLAKTLRECIVLAIVILWLVYVDQKLYGKRKWNSRTLLLVFLPLALFLAILLINLFTGIAFTYSSENRFEPRPLLYFIFAVEFAYFAFTAVMVVYYDRRSMKPRFLHVSPMLISIAAASSAQLFTPYDIGILGYVMGITLLYFSVADESRFVDEESELYNNSFLVYLFNLALAGRYEARSALILQANGNLAAGFEILHDLLFKDYDVIRLEDRKFIMFSGNSSLSALQLLTTQVEEAVARHNAEHPDEKVFLTMNYRMRGKEENSFEFLRSTIEEKDTADPVRGVVSMISELDRLDEELKLAGDIQLNMLPMKFPPFPDHTEFDLYASMTPAKEVGGDFYDFFLIDDDHLALVIADVSGKGIPASLFMMVSRTLIKNQLMSGCDPAAALERVNLQLCERNSSMMFVTVWLGILELSTGKGCAVNAGHENPGVRRADGSFELLKYKHNICIGATKRAKYQNREFELHAGDCIFVYTDGVPEANNASDALFGPDRLLETLNQDPDAAPDELIHRVHGAVDQFADGAAQFDDITMLCLKYYGGVSK